MIDIAHEKIIIGADIVPQTSASKNPHYAVCVYDGIKEKVIDSFENVNFHKLISIIQKTQANFLATDNVYELVSSPSYLPYLCIQLSPSTKLVQVTGSPIHGFTPLTKLMRKYGLEVTGKPAPSESAKACAILANKKIGYRVEPFEDETKIVVSRSRSKGAGGWSQGRYGRLYDTSVLQVANEVETVLKEHDIDYDKHITKSKYGAKKVVFDAYSPLNQVLSIIKNKKGELCQVKIFPVNKEHVEFIPLSQEVTLKPKLKRLIVGIDPGLTVGLSILDLRGKVLKTLSLRQASRGHVIRAITKFGKPTLVCCDVYPYPSYVEKIAGNLNGKLFAPRSILTVAEKNRIARQLAIEQGIVIKDAHQRDSLAAAFSGYKKYREQFSKVDEKYLHEFDKNLRDEIKDLLVRGRSLNDSVDYIRKELEKEKKKEEKIITIEEIKDIKPEKVLEENRSLKERINLLEKQLEEEKSKNAEIFSENEELKREIDYLRDKLAQGKEKYIRGLYKEKIFLQKDSLINSLKEKNKALKDELDFYAAKIDELKRIVWLRTNENWVALKVIKKFTQEEIEKTNEIHELRPGDIVYILNTTGGGGQTAELLVKYKIKAIIGDIENLSYYAKTKFMKYQIPLIDRERVNPLRMDEIAIIEEKEIDDAIEKARKELEQIIIKEKESILENLVDEYRKERKRELGENI
ncbi:MAG: DUF460 domain-containing protein [Candidatus Heimdallarchaeum endolithica]|uniref:DUF460 domain-containing protein n=1 Tax=Candidatus Heimdallarchaeum endolithica TaxID=2876572 RepID=A0A9Y1BTU7_9ARCH|nr:MAG: DUF460 domain-containing protein [Candidatus Heimdallarchaeum endolithica]